MAVEKPAEFRRLTHADLEMSMRLFEYAFQLERTDEEREEEMKQTVPDWTWGAFVDGRLAAQVVQIPLEVYIQGRKLGMGGIGGVSSWPEARRGGLVAGLLARIIRAMKEDGQAISFLAPFSFAFYRKYGWEMAIDRKKYTVPSHLWPVPAKEQVPGTVERMPRDEVGLIRELGPVYEQYAARYNGTVSRTPDWWAKRVIRRKRDGEFAVYRDEAGRIAGYLQYRVKQREVTVLEFVALTPQAERALWRFIALHDSMAERAVLYVSVDDGLSFMGAEPRFRQETEPYFMARIVDMEAFLAAYAFATLADRPVRWAEHRPAVFALEVEDAQAPWNNGRFRVAVDEEGRAEVVRPAGDVDERWLIRGTIQAFTALFTGYRRAAELARLGRLSGSGDALALADALLAARTPFLLDFF